MGQSLAKILTHIIFSTKNREPMICPEIREEVNAYFVGILKQLESPGILINCVADHAHILCRLSKNYALAKVIEEVKKGTSKWMKTKSPSLQAFYWQNGYGAFSVSQSKVVEVKEYIAAQEEHHRRTTFRDEFRAFLRRHQVEYDER